MPIIFAIVIFNIPESSSSSDMKKIIGDQQPSTSQGYTGQVRFSDQTVSATASTESGTLGTTQLQNGHAVGDAITVLRHDSAGSPKTPVKIALLPSTSSASNNNTSNNSVIADSNQMRQNSRPQPPVWQQQQQTEERLQPTSWSRSVDGHITDGLIASPPSYAAAQNFSRQQSNGGLKTVIASSQSVPEIHTVVIASLPTSPPHIPNSQTFNSEKQLIRNSLQKES